MSRVHEEGHQGRVGKEGVVRQSVNVEEDKEEGQGAPHPHKAAGVLEGAQESQAYVGMATKRQGRMLTVRCAGEAFFGKFAEIAEQSAAERQACLDELGNEHVGLEVLAPDELSESVTCAKLCRMIYKHGTDTISNWAMEHGLNVRSYITLVVT